ncbi:LuxR C-terminal-related transcriptional regulator [Streptomyces sp. Je 1-79]|uniref:helix-turn-helix transcriptional regulator n=1 Tax=Streptomyces sp. Je 1-79 TaxID=2943847 RepID=UPI0021A4F06E|nr:helix-turn-helix transcriptional regulator [Streptomyces sp. Je 1-79]MCT4353380.1 LuxR C-terminal-related transcriptional regulator [Streptomyces sp. Je 1-79]
MAENAMAVFGVSALEEELYRHFLRNPDTPADDVHLLLHTDPDETRVGLERLRALELVHPERPDGRVSPADPETALTRLTDRRLGELHRELQRVTRSRHVIDGLRAETAARTEPAVGIEQVEGLANIRNRIDDLAFFARDEILAVETYPRLSPENIARSRPLDLRCLRRGVRIRNVVVRAALDDLPTADYLRELAAHGAEIRVTGETAERMIVYDRSTALVPLDPRNTARGALLAHRSGLVSNIIALFEKIWESADDLASPEGRDGSVPGHGLTERERRVLSFMCTGGKDEAGARELEVSVRTYRRYVAELLQTLGANSRAQAALLARDRGWI